MSDLQRRIERLAAQAVADAGRGMAATPEQARETLAAATLDALVRVHGADAVARQCVADFPGWATASGEERTAAIITLWQSDADALRWLRQALRERANG